MVECPINDKEQEFAAAAATSEFYAAGDLEGVRSPINRLWRDLHDLGCRRYLVYLIRSTTHLGKASYQGEHITAEN
jgi:hypothetical protein